MTPDPLAVELARHFALHGPGQYPVCACDRVARHSPEHVAQCLRRSGLADTNATSLVEVGGRRAVLHELSVICERLDDELLDQSVAYGVGMVQDHIHRLQRELS